MSDAYESDELRNPHSDNAEGGAPGGASPDPPAPEPTMDAIDREVAEAMGEMDSADLAEICGQPVVSDPGTPSESVEPGTELTGTIATISDDEVFLEFGPKSQGILQRSQFGKKELVEIGRRVDVVVERYDSDAGLLIVYRKGALQRATWQSLSVGMIVAGKVTGMNKGGLEVDLNGIRGFMPASHCDVVPMKDISELLNERVKCEVLEVDRRGKNVLLSRRKLLEREVAEQKEKLKSELAAGQVHKGIVGTIMEYGAFVDIGGMDGLLHIRDLSWGSVEKVSDVVSPGQEIEVQILKFDAERGRISLGLKQCQPNPWTNVKERYPVGSEHNVRIIRLVDFGAFAELETGVEGLIPISEMSWNRTNRASDVVSEGEVVASVVIRLEPEVHRIALSMKQAQEDPWGGVLETFEENSIVPGRVTRLADFGAFVELVPGVEGLVHISELAEHRVNSCSDVLTVGQEVETRVLGVDQENRRISLSIKAVAGPAEVAQVAPEAQRKPKKRKKPLRGGLASHYEW